MGRFTSDGVDIFQLKSRWGAAYLWVDPPLNAQGLVTLALEGNDPSNVIPPFIPRPASGGIFLGYDQEGVFEKPNLSYDEITSFGSTVPKDVKVKEETTTVSSKLVFNNDPIIRSVFLPTGVYNRMGFAYGGNASVPLRGLLVIITNELDISMVECHYYYRGYFEPSPYAYGKLFSPLEMVYHAISGVRINENTGTTCLLPAGQRIMRAWYIRINEDGLNIQLDDHGNDIIPDPYPQLTYLLTRPLYIL